MRLLVYLYAKLGGAKGHDLVLAHVRSDAVVVALVVNSSGVQFGPEYVQQVDGVLDVVLDDAVHAAFVAHVVLAQWQSGT